MVLYSHPDTAGQSRVTSTQHRYKAGCPATGWIIPSIYPILHSPSRCIQPRWAGIAQLPSTRGTGGSWTGPGTRGSDRNTQLLTWGRLQMPDEEQAACQGWAAPFSPMCLPPGASFSTQTCRCSLLPQLSHFMVHYFQHSAFPSARSNRGGISKHHIRLARAIHTLSPSGPSPACCPCHCPVLLVPDHIMDAHSGCRNLLQNLNIPHSPPSPYLLWQLYPRTTPANYLSMTSLAWMSAR